MTILGTAEDGDVVIGVQARGRRSAATAWQLEARKKPLRVNAKTS
jgi:hypothetical protein